MKRIFAISIIVFSLATLAADWPQLLGPSRNGHSREKDLIGTFDDKGPTVAWQRDVGEGYASPVIAGGRLLLYHRVENEDVLESLDADTGKFRWKYAYATKYRDPLNKGNGPRATPVVSGGKIYLLSASGQLHCVDQKTGKKVWVNELLKTYKVPDSFFGVGMTPIVEGDHVIVNVGGEEAGIVAFNKDTGKEVWKSTAHEASYSSPVSATINDVRHVVFFTREGLASIDPVKGTVRATKRWRASDDASVNAAMPLVLGGDHLFLTASYRTGAILLKVKKDGVEEVWKNDKSLSSHFSTPVAIGDQLYGFHGRQEVGAELRCIDWKTGKVRWSKDGFGCGSLIHADGKLFVLSEFGDLVIVEPNADKYIEKARATVLGKPCRAHPALADGLLYARDNKKLVCWKVKK
jgi:outer membrane protein assembly factor BamB